MPTYQEKFGDAPDIVTAHGLQHRLPTAWATGPLWRIVKDLGLSLDDPADVLLAKTYRLAATVERSSRARLVDAVGTGGAFSHSPDGFQVDVHARVYDPQAGTDAPDFHIDSARDRGFLRTVQNASQRIYEARRALDNLDELKQALTDILTREAGQ
jgi:hypothetical protein